MNFLVTSRGDSWTLLFVLVVQLQVILRGRASPIFSGNFLDTVLQIEESAFPQLIKSEYNAPYASVGTNSMIDLDCESDSSFLRITKRMVDSISFVPNVNLASNLEDSLVDEALFQGWKFEMKEGIETEAEAAVATTKSSRTSEKRNKPRNRKRRFNDQVQIFFIPPLDEGDSEKLFYSEEEISNFRHEAFLEECGLSAEDFTHE